MDSIIMQIQIEIHNWICMVLQIQIIYTSTNNISL